MRGQSFQHGRTVNSIMPWYERDNGVRLANDQCLVLEAYPNLNFRIDEVAKRVYLEGTITLCECGVPTIISLRIEFPYRYPAYEPRVYHMDDAFPHIADRHFHPDGRCCLWLDIETCWKSDDPTALRRFLDEVALFFDRQLVYDALPKSMQRWPGGERAHGNNGYVEVISELLDNDEGLLRTLAPTLAGKEHPGQNSLCPCGSGDKFKRCHQTDVRKIKVKIQPETLSRVMRTWLLRNST